MKMNAHPDDDKPVIEVQGLVNTFGDFNVHEGLDLTVRRGEILGVVGGSGTGKSVLMRSILGLQSYQAGRVWWFGQEVSLLPEADRRALEREPCR